MPRLPRSPHDDANEGSQTQESQPTVDPQIAARRRERLQRRIGNLKFDIRQAASAGQRNSRWNQRVDEINAAVQQAGSDLESLTRAPDAEDLIPLQPLPIEEITVTTEQPATITFNIGGEAFRYSEEVDWTERGEQRLLPGLRRFEGEAERLIPPGFPEERHATLLEHLRHALGAFAVALRDGQVAAQSELSLADLASPCPECGNWRDHRDRCITCQRRAWRATELRSEIERMTEERNRLLEEIANQREALPILQRQLQDAQKELEKYSAG